ncbi:hypothetical protein Tsubulata_003051 [Turnera subulata]|uniref:RNB domain-containing protein n=1 Tax=Turnera subulata TaxID=218843 RepID=A0A9Q0JB14_9ROSI|nr:hypothetical protein Tsubulata_003051 [Turnera subulata]
METGFSSPLSRNRENRPVSNGLVAHMTFMLQPGPCLACWVRPGGRTNRKDLTHLKVYAIDVVQADELDDALSATRLQDGRIKVWIHVADPTRYVQPGSIVDREARKRGTSVFLPTATYPMFPEKLAMEGMSLKQGELCNAVSVSVILHFDGCSGEAWTPPSTATAWASPTPPATTTPTAPSNRGGRRVVSAGGAPIPRRLCCWSSRSRSISMVKGTARMRKVVLAIHAAFPVELLFLQATGSSRAFTSHAQPGPDAAFSISRQQPDAATLHHKPLPEGEASTGEGSNKKNRPLLRIAAAAARTTTREEAVQPQRPSHAR